MVSDVFISHVPQDSEIAQKISLYLEAKNLRCWIAPRDILPGQSRDEAVLLAILGSRFFVLVLSLRAAQSPELLKEVRAAKVADLPCLIFRLGEEVVLSAEARMTLEGCQIITADLGSLKDGINRLAERIADLEHLRLADATLIERAHVGKDNAFRLMVSCLETNPEIAIREIENLPAYVQLTPEVRQLTALVHWRIGNKAETEGNLGTAILHFQKARSAIAIAQPRFRASESILMQVLPDASGEVLSVNLPGEIIEHHLAGCLNARAVAEANEKNFEAAIADLKRAASLVPEDKTITRNLKTVYVTRGGEAAQRGDLGKATSFLEQAADLDPSDEELNRNLAACFNAQGVTMAKENNWDGAVAALERAASLAPGDKTILKNLEYLKSARGFVRGGSPSSAPPLAAMRRWLPKKEFVPQTAEAPVEQLDRVNFSVGCPAAVLAESSFIIEVWAHLKQQRREVVRMIRYAAGGGDISVRSKGPVRLARGTILTVRLKSDELIIKDPEDTILWDGEIGNATFCVAAPSNVSAGSKAALAMVYANGLQVAKIYFTVLVHRRKAKESEKVSSKEVKLNSAFVSYASEDRDEVLARVQGIQKAAPGMKIFLDVLSLRSGQHWEKELWKIIPKQDIFYLFWSESARTSKWVEKEWRCALETRGLDFIDPVPLVSPEIVPPPPELSGKHFNDWTLAFRRGQNVRPS